MLVLTSTSPKGEHNTHELPVGVVEAEVRLPSESGSTTPTAASSDGSAFSRYSKISIGFPPLRGFLRSRNASASATGRVSVRSDPEVGEEAQDGVALASGVSSERVGDDDDDRRTIRGVVVECGEEAKTEGEVRDRESVEKSVDDASTAVPCNVMVAGAT